MGILNKIKSAISGAFDTEFESIINESRLEYAKKHVYFWDVKVTEISIYTNEVMSWSDKKKIDFMVHQILKINEFSKIKKGYSTDDTNLQKIWLREGYIKQLLKTKLILEDIDAERIITGFIQNRRLGSDTILGWPLKHVLNLVERQMKVQNLSAGMLSSLNALKLELQRIHNPYYASEKLKLIERLNRIVFIDQNEGGTFKKTLFLGEDEFTAFANPQIEALPEAEQQIWFQLIAKAQKASGGKPTKKYLDETKLIFQQLSNDKFKKIVNVWFEFVTQFKEKTITSTFVINRITYTSNSFEFLSAVNLEALKGFVWMCSHFHDSATLFQISNLAERCFRKITGKGSAAAGLGNACLFTLYKSKGLEGIGYLSQLRLKIKQNNTQKIIETYLMAAATERGISVYEIEDLAVDDFGLTDGRRVFEFEDYRAELIIKGLGKTETNWIKADGSIQKSVPVFVKEKHAGKLKKLKDVQKQVEKSLTSQRDRIDRMLRIERVWNYQNFIDHYLRHGLMTYLTKKIIWNFSSNGKTESAIFMDNHWVNSENQEVIPDENSEVTLWHPVEQSLVEIQKWRQFLLNNQIQQPLKQAYREVYLLTDAEIRTKTYSNRMAAHILKQHQFVTLAKGRNWSARLQGDWDNGNNGITELVLEDFQLKAQFWVQGVEMDNAANDYGILNYVSTDQVRFEHLQTSESVDLVDVPKRPFSEVMRDVDLFVGVASVGNDPTWRDNGGIPAYRDYWTSYSFGDLTEVAKNRKEILTGLLPRLKISKIAEIKDKFLVVKGQLRTYKIHLGSTNILMEPNDQYLCIVPDRNAKSPTENLFIPFEGDNGLSIILSKAFLLADDHKITDSSITSQINSN